MTINPHITQALARGRTADLLHESAAYRIAAEAAEPTEPEPRPQPAQHEPLDLIPAGAEER